MDWITFYDFKHSAIYVNARHRDVHYRTIAEDIRKYIPSPTAHVLDFGCGEANSADLIANACGQLVLVEDPAGKSQILPRDRHQRAGGNGQNHACRRFRPAVCAARRLV